MPDRLDRTLATLPQAYPGPGPGGAVAVLRAGELLARHAWGWANAEQRIPFTPGTLFRMCSITKQFTVAALLDAVPDPTVLDADLRARLPHLRQPPPGALHLCHNQSGLRDYWALAMLHGAPAESPFGDAEAAAVIGRAQTLQFAPGTSYSYCNQNFRLLSDLLAARAGRSFAELLRTRVFTPAGMPTAFLAADTRAMPDGTEGYEGTQAGGFRPAVNRILWTGDAGLGASLDDMIAWERHVDASRDAPDSLPARLAAPVCFADGTPADYGFGLSRRPLLGRRATGHGGALRGWRSMRLYVPEPRVSVVVLFNHMADAHQAALDLLAAVLDEPPPPPAATLPSPDWLGTYLVPETGLSARIDRTGDGQLRLRYGHSAELLTLQPDGTAGSGPTRLRPQADGLWLDRPQENWRGRLQPVTGTAGGAIAGRYRCAELDADLTIAEAGGVAYGAFSGFLGQGRMELLEQLAPDLWLLPCPRALDHTPPGDWTLRFVGDGVEVGCWLARGLRYERQ